jgi:hypothetical protein
MQAKRRKMTKRGHYRFSKVDLLEFDTWGEFIRTLYGEKVNEGRMWIDLQFTETETLQVCFSEKELQVLAERIRTHLALFKAQREGKF